MSDHFGLSFSDGEARIPATFYSTLSIVDDHTPPPGPAPGGLDMLPGTFETSIDITFDLLLQLGFVPVDPTHSAHGRSLEGRATRDHAPPAEPARAHVPDAPWNIRVPFSTRLTITPDQYGRHGLIPPRRATPPSSDAALPQQTVRGQIAAPERAAAELRALQSIGAGFRAWARQPLLASRAGQTSSVGTGNTAMDRVLGVTSPPSATTADADDSLFAHVLSLTTPSPQPAAVVPAQQETGQRQGSAEIGFARIAGAKGDPGAGTTPHLNQAAHKTAPAARRTSSLPPGAPSFPPPPGRVQTARDLSALRHSVDHPEQVLNRPGKILLAAGGEEETRNLAADFAEGQQDLNEIAYRSAYQQLRSIDPSNPLLGPFYRPQGWRPTEQDARQIETMLATVRSRLLGPGPALFDGDPRPSSRADSLADKERYLTFLRRDMKNALGAP